MSDEAPQLRRVLCALNLDDSGGKLWPLASTIAQRFGASVDALYAPSPLLSFGGRADRVRRLITEHNARERLESMVEPFGDSLKVSTYVTRGQASDVILSHSLRRDADLIVLGASSSYTSTVAPVSEGATCAVLTMPTASTGRALQRILLPVGSLVADAPATAWCIALASRFGAQVTVLRVGTPKPGFWTTITPWRDRETPARDEQRTSFRAGATSLRLERAGVSAPQRAQLEPADYDAIAKHGERGGFDLIVMGLHTQGDSATDGQRVIADLRRRATTPILSVRAMSQPASLARLDHDARSPGHDTRVALSA